MNQDPLFDLSKLVELSMGDQEFVKRMIDIFITQTRDNLAIFETSLKEKDYKRIHYIAHQMKPTVNILRIHDVKDDLLKLEENADQLKNIHEIPEQIKKITIVLNEVIAQLIKMEN